MGIANSTEHQRNSMDEIMIDLTPPPPTAMLSHSESLQVLETITDSGIVPLLGSLLTSSGGDVLGLCSPKHQPPPVMLRHALKVLNYTSAAKDSCINHSGGGGGVHEDGEDRFNVRMSFKDAKVVAARSKRTLSLLPLRAYHTALKHSLGLEKEPIKHGVNVQDKSKPTATTTSNTANSNAAVSHKWLVSDGEDDEFCDAATAIGLDYLEHGVSFGYQAPLLENETGAEKVDNGAQGNFVDISNTLKMDAIKMGTHHAAVDLLMVLAVQAVSIDSSSVTSDNYSSYSSCSTPNLSRDIKHEEDKVSQDTPSSSSSSSFDSSNAKKLKSAMTNQV
jgi:hypothetical protein